MKNGPKMDKRGNKFWYKNGELHREDGPAIEYANGNKFWYTANYIEKMVLLLKQKIEHILNIGLMESNLISQMILD